MYSIYLFAKWKGGIQKLLRSLIWHGINNYVSFSSIHHNNIYFMHNKTFIISIYCHNKPIWRTSIHNNLTLHVFTHELQHNYNFRSWKFLIRPSKASKICLNYRIPVQVIKIGLAENLLLSEWQHVVEYGPIEVVGDVVTCVELGTDAGVCFSDGKRHAI